MINNPEFSRCNKEGIPQSLQEDDEGIPQLLQEDDGGIPQLFQEDDEGIPQLLQQDDGGIPQLFQEDDGGIPQLFQRRRWSIMKVYLSLSCFKEDDGVQITSAKADKHLSRTLTVRGNIRIWHCIMTQ